MARLSYSEHILVLIFFSLVSTFTLVLPMVSFSLNLVQNSTIFISLVGTFIRLLLGLGGLQQYIVMNIYIASKHLL
jgi:hypothetical protein